MVRLLSTLLLSFTTASLLAGCGAFDVISDGDAPYLDKRLERRDSGTGKLLNRWGTRGDSMGTRFEKMKNWENERSEVWWDRIMD